MEVLKTLFLDFIKSPTQENFLKVRSALLVDSKFDPYTSAGDNVPQLMERGEFEQAEEVMRNALLPHLLLSPGAHLNLAFIHHKLGREREAGFEHHISRLIQKAIEETGDGTEARPYLVTRTSDEYDFFYTHDLKVGSQALVKSPDGERSCDLLTTTDGREVWFDITDIMRLMSKRMN